MAVTYYGSGLSPAQTLSNAGVNPSPAQQLAAATQNQQQSSALGGSNNSAQQLAAATQQPSTFGGTNNAPAGTSGIRSTLNQMGFPNQDIGFNQGTGQVSLSGPGLQTQNISPDANLGGTTYASPTDIQGAAQATGWQPQQEQQINDLVSSLVAKINAPQTTYDPTQDPAYQSASAAAQLNERQAAGQVGGMRESAGALNSGQAGTLMQNATIPYQESLAAMIPGLESNYENQQQQGITNAMQGVNTLENLQATTAQEQLAQATLAMNENRYGAEAANWMTTSAINKTKAAGYIPDQPTAEIMGLPIGTPSAQALQAAATLQLKQQQVGIDQERADTSASDLAYRESQTGTNPTSSQNADAIIQTLQYGADVISNGQAYDLSQVLSDAMSTGAWGQMTKADQARVNAFYAQITKAGALAGTY